MDNLTVIKSFMAENKLDYLLVNTTNEFLVEYNTLAENSIYKLTNFSGSTAEVLITPDKVYLFVDGRYHIQADNEVCHELVTVIKLQTGQQFITEILKKLPVNSTLGLFAKKVSQLKYEKYREHINVKLLPIDPLDVDIINDDSENICLNENYTGLLTDEKIAKLRSYLNDDEAVYITDLDEVSYLFNMRNFKIQEYSAKIKAKALVSNSEIKLYSGEKLNDLYKDLLSLKSVVYVDKSTINAYDYSLLKQPRTFEKSSPIRIMKAHKNSTEIEHLKVAFEKTDNAVKAIRKYIIENDNISEYDITLQLEKEFKNQGAVGLSFKSIVAHNKNSALAHYSKCSKDEILKDGSLVLIDCGAYFDGGLATDITRVFVKGTPSKLQQKIYTLTLKAFLLAYNSKLSELKTGFEIDNKVREFFNSVDTEGFVFNHGLGHGIGINVHEYPPNLSKNEIAKVNIEDGMCFSIEPGLYKENFFGVRLENSCYCQNGEIKSFVKMNYEKALIDFDMLTDIEKQQLSEFEVI